MTSPTTSVRSGPGSLPEPDAPRGARFLHEAFLEHSLRRPGAIAISHADEQVTYSQLRASSATVARMLRAAGIGAGATVGVLMPRSPELPAVLLGILRAGAAYCVVDPQWPLARLGEIQNLFSTPYLVTDRSVIDADRADLAWLRLPTGGVHAWADTETETGIAFTEPELLYNPDEQSAAVFMTSGTSGLPKPSLSSHGAMTRLLNGSFIDLDAHCVIPLGAPPYWDAFGLEMWGALSSGGTAVILDAPALDPQTLRTVIRRERADTAWMSTSLFNLAVDEDLEAFRGLRQLVIGGERLNPGLVERFLRAHPGIRLVNGYGPVECTVFVTTHEIRLQDCQEPAGIPLGRPVPDTWISVLDEAGEPVAPGVRGEICVGGVRVGAGYLGDPAATAARFRRHGSGILYHTGDLGFLSDDGLLHFAGRLDRQIKLRGHRVEPDSVEAALVEVPGIDTCVVVPLVEDRSREHPSAEPRGRADQLVAVYTSTTGTPVSLAQITPALRNQLAEYQIPDRFHHVAKLPILPNGKVDHRAAAAAARSWAAHPTTRPEGGQVHESRVGCDLVLDTVRDVTGTVPDEEHSLAEAGVSSLDLMRICSRLSRHSGRPVPASQLHGRSLADLRRWLEERAGQVTGDDEATSGISPDTFSPWPLLPMQTGLLLADSLLAGDAANCALAWWTDASLDVGAWADACTDLVGRHQALRASYHLSPEPVAAALPSPGIAAGIDLGVAFDDTEALELITDAALESLRPETGQVLRWAVVTSDASGRSLASVSVHHVAWDAASEAIAVADLGHCYRERAAGRQPRFDALAPSPAEVRNRVDQRRASTDQEAQRVFWAGYLRGLEGRELLAVEQEPSGASGGPRTKAGSTGHIDLVLPPAVTVTCDRLATDIGTTRFGVLLTAFARAVRLVTGQTDLGIGVPVSRRGDAVLDEAVDCLIDVVCVRTAPDPSAPPGKAIGDVAGRLRAALAAQDIGIDEIVRLWRSTSGSTGTPHRVMFTVEPHDVPLLEIGDAVAEGLRILPAESMTDLRCTLWPQDNGGHLARLTYRPGEVNRATADAIGEEMLAWLALSC